MEPVVTPEAMGRADRRTIDAGTPVAVLMERAGRAVAWEARRAIGGCYGSRAVVVCGKGNNGGDGQIAAAALERWGARTHVIELAAGVDRPTLARALSRADVAIDAMYGTGFRGALEGDAAWFVDELSVWGGPVVAVDVPSGVDGLTGGVHGTAVRATNTVTFAARKPGLVFEPGRSHAGAITVAPIGIDLGADGADPPPIAVFDVDDVRRAVPPRAPGAHKWTAGVMVVGGSGGMTGAPMFVSHAAMRSGAGIVWCGLPGEEAAYRAGGTEVITRALPVAPDGALTPLAADAVLAEISRFRALAVGPGLGSDPGMRQTVCTLVAEARVPLVLDADGLNVVHRDYKPLRARQNLGVPTVLTPHDGEYARLAGVPVGDDRMAAASRLADQTGAVVLLKGPATVIAEPGSRRVVLNATGSSALATAGSGDVLTGVIAAFLARGMPGFEAAASRGLGARARRRSGRPHDGPNRRDRGRSRDGDRTGHRRSGDRRSRRRPRGKTLMAGDATVSSIMTRDVITLSPEQSVPDAADVLAEHRIGAAPVVVDGRLVGLLSDEDLIVSEAKLHVPTVIEFLGAELVWPRSEKRWEAELKKAAASTVADVMSTDVPTLGPDDSVEAAATLMHDRNASHVCVVEGDRLVGVVARGDLVRHLAAGT